MIHGLLLLQHKRYAADAVRLCSFIAEKRNIRKIVDKRRDREEEHAAETDRRPCSAPELPACRSILPAGNTGAYHVREEHHGEPGSGVQARPFGCHAETEAYAARAERKKELFERLFHVIHLDIVCHEQNHEQNEKQDNHIDRGNTRLCKVHRVQRKERRGQKRQISPAEQPLCQRKKHRQHCRAEKRRNDAPPERLHAEDHNAEHDEDLAERRMRPFVYAHRMEKLIRCAGMVDLVKVHAVQIAWLIRYRVRLIKKRRALRCSGGDHGRKAVAGGIEEGDLVERDLSRRALQCYIPRVHDGGLRAPGKHGRVFLRILRRGAVVAGEHRRALGNVSVRPYFGNIIFRTEIDAYCRTALRCPHARRKRERAEIQKREYRINESQRPHQALIATV